MFIGQRLPAPFARHPMATAAPGGPPAPKTASAPLRPEDLAARAQQSPLNSAYDHLLTPDTLAALLALDANGAIKTDAEGNLQIKDPAAATAEDWFLFGLARAEMRPTPGGSGMTAGDEAFFTHMTGCTRVEMGGGLFTICGPEGEPAPLESPAWQLAALIPAHRAAGYLAGEITAAWFMPWAERCAGEGMLPKDWLNRARSWFDERA